MQACQLCGAKSWGPLALGDLTVAGVVVLATELLRCDHCTALARKSLLEKPALNDTLLGSYFVPRDDPMVDGLKAAAGVMQSITQRREHETRAERLVHSILRRPEPWLDPHQILSITQIAVRVVQLARQLETELDKVPE